jgi:hypothetical protein
VMTQNILKPRAVTFLMAILITWFCPAILPYLSTHMGEFIFSSIPEVEASAEIEIRRPTAFTDNVGNAIAPQNAYDSDVNSSARIPTGTDALPSIVYHGFNPKAGIYESFTLNVSRSSEKHVDDKWGIKYSLNGGSSWLTLDPMSSRNFAKDKVSASLDPSQDLTKLRVRIDTDRVKTTDNGCVFTYDIWTEGKILVPPTRIQASYRFFQNIDSADLSAIVSNVNGAGEANAIAIDPPDAGNPLLIRHMYVAGFEPGKWRIEKRKLEDGGLVGSIAIDTGGGEANDIATDSFYPNDPLKKRYMYVVGDDYSGGNYRWRIEKRSLEDLSLDNLFGEGGVVFSDPSTANDSAYAIAIDPPNPTGEGAERYMYIVGSDRINGSANSQWRIEKRKLSDGLVVGVALSNPSIDDDVPLAIAIDPYDSNPAKERFMYVVGYDRSPGASVRNKKGTRSESYAEWRIEKRPLLNPSILVKSTTSNPVGHPAYARGVAVDANSIYIVGSEELGFFDTAWRIEKRDIVTLDPILSIGGSGAEPGNYGYDDQASSISIDPVNGSMYIAGYSATLVSPEGNADTEWRIEKRKLDDGSLVTEFGTSGFVVNDIYSNSNDRARAVAIDPSSGSMYVAGYDNPGLPEWRIEKRSLVSGSAAFLEPLDLQDTGVTIAPGGKFRLRMLIHVEAGTLLAGAGKFKLQFEVNDGGWADVNESTPIAFFKNFTPIDGDPILANGEDPVYKDPTTGKAYPIRYQSYEDSLGFSNSMSGIGPGEDGMWDFSLQATPGSPAGTYQLRIVNDNSELEGYNSYPVIRIIQ